MSLKSLYSLIFFLLILTNAHASIFIPLNGYLGREELTKAKMTLEEIVQKFNKDSTDKDTQDRTDTTDNKDSTETLLIEINSTSGDLNKMLGFAKKIYELKSTNKLKVIVYIDQNAIGPSAILPFLADEINISPFVSWGDIPLGSDNIVPTNILRNQVRSLIAEHSTNSQTLNILADAMTDPSIQVVDDNGWKVIGAGKDSSQYLVSPTGQTMVVNHNQLQKQNLVAHVFSLKDFKSTYGIDNSSTNVHSSINSNSSTEDISPNLNPASRQTLNPNEQTDISTTPINSLAFASFEEELKKHIHFNPNGQNVIGRIVIDDRANGINESTWLYVKKAVDYYKKIKPIFIIVELNTPGGEIYAAQKISDALKDLDINDKIPVVAYINNWAISAGAMIAYSSRFITTVKDGSMGAAEPVIAGASGQMETASEKINSAIRADFANRARFYGRNPLIAEAMVDKDKILVMRHGKITKLDNEKEIHSTGPDRDVIISAKGKLLTLDAEQMLEFGVANAILQPEKLEAITPAEKETGNWPATKSLLFQQPFFKDIPNAKISSYVMDWKTQFFVWLASPMVSSLLFLGMIVGAYIELNTPGATLPGVVAGLCLFLITLSSFSLEIANWLELILLLSGIFLILLELFVLPTVGILAVIGVLFFLAGLFGMMLPAIGTIGYEHDNKTINAAGEYFFRRLGWLCATLLAGVGIIVLLARYVMPTFKGFQRFVLSGNEQVGYTSVEPDSLPNAGSIGEVYATLRPGGKVIIDQKIYDAISNGAFLEKNAKVIVVRTEGNTLIVDEIKKGKTI